MNSTFDASPRRTAAMVLAIVALPILVVPLSPLLSAAIGVASAHLWLYNMPVHSSAAGLPSSPVGWMVAMSGLGWLMAGMMLLAQIH